MKGRTIFDAVRTIDEKMEFTERYQIQNGLLVAIDFQKAFDSINHDFMFKALSVFNFGPSFITEMDTNFLQKYFQHCYE